MSAVPTTDPGLLAAQAKAGQAGVDAYNAAKDALTKQRQQAVDQAMKEAALRGAPGGSLESIQSTVTSPYDQRIASMTQAAGAAGEANAAQAARMAAYNSAANASRGLIPGQIELATAPIRAETAFKVAQIGQQGRADVDKINAQIRLLEAQAAAAAAAAARRGGGGGGGRGGGGGGQRTMTASELKSALASGAHKNISTQVNQTKQVAQSVPSAADAQWANMAAAYTGKSQQLEQMKARGADEETIGLFVGAGGKPKSAAEVQQPAAAPGKGGGNFFQRLFSNPVLNQARSLVDLLGQQGRQNMSAYQRTGQMPSGQSTAQRNAINSLLGIGVGSGGGGGGGGSWGGGPASAAMPEARPPLPSYLAAQPQAPTPRTGEEQAALQRLRSIPVGRDTTDQYASPQQAATTAFRRMIAGPLEGGKYQRPEMLNPEYRFPEAIRAPSGLAMTNPMTGDQYLASSTEEQGDVTTGSRFGMEDAAQRLLEDPEAMQQAMRDYAVELAESGQLKGINPEDVINAIGGGVYQPGQSAAEYADIMGGSKQAKAVEKDLQSQADRAKRLGTEEEKATDEEADSVFRDAYGVDPNKISGVARDTALRIGGSDQFKNYVSQLSSQINPFTAKEDVQSVIEGMVQPTADYASVVRMLQHILVSGGMQESE